MYTLDCLSFITITAKRRVRFVVPHIRHDSCHYFHYCQSPWTYNESTNQTIKIHYHVVVFVQPEASCMDFYLCDVIITSKTVDWRRPYSKYLKWRQHIITIIFIIKSCFCFVSKGGFKSALAYHQQHTKTTTLNQSLLITIKITRTIFLVPILTALYMV